MADHVIELAPPPFEQAVDVVDEGRLRVLEVYLADGQGEGIWTGAPSVFVRLAGCTVGCKYCDTKYSWRAAQGAWWYPSELVAAVKKQAQGASHVVLTGGEPLEHPEESVRELVMRLRGAGFTVTIETSGTQLIDPYLWNQGIEVALAGIPQGGGQFLWSVAPKLSWSGARFRTTPGLIEAWVDIAQSMGALLQFKWVCLTPDDVFEVYLIMQRFFETTDRKVSPFSNFIQTATDTSIEDDVVMIQDVLRRTKELQEMVARHPQTARWANHGVITMVRPQLHVLMHGKKRLV